MDMEYELRSRGLELVFKQQFHDDNDKKNGHLLFWPSRVCFRASGGNSSRFFGLEILRFCIRAPRFPLRSFVYT